MTILKVKTLQIKSILLAIEYSNDYEDYGIQNLKMQGHSR